MKTFTFYIKGMHCKACVALTEDEVKGISGVVDATSSLKDHTIVVSGDFGAQTPEQIAEDLTKRLQPHGYAVSIEKFDTKVAWSDFKVAIPIALGITVVFVALQKMGIVNWVSVGNVTYGTAFVIGIVASLSTCMAIVGGLVLSMSATFAKEGNRTRPQVMFHGARLVSFFILGGVIGAIGSAFTLNATATFVLGLIIGIVMLILGLNLLDIFDWAKRLQPAMPKFMGERAQRISKFNHTLTPALVGIATFFLPCGFTQSMQLYTLSTGNFLTGGLTMLAFAFGTLPVLALVSFSSVSVKNSPRSGIFFKMAGLVVILFALFNILNSLAAVGLISPLFNF